MQDACELALQAPKLKEQLAVANTHITRLATDLLNAREERDAVKAEMETQSIAFQARIAELEAKNEKLHAAIRKADAPMKIEEQAEVRMYLPTT